MDNPQELFERGRSAAEEGDLRGALAMVSALMEHHPQRPQGAEELDRQQLGGHQSGVCI